MLQGAPVCGRGIRERAPGKGVMDSDASAYSSGKTQSGGKRKRARARGVKVSDIPAGYLDTTSVDGTRERAAAWGVEDLGSPAQISDMTYVGLKQDSLNVGKGKREKAPVEVAEVSENLSTQLGTSLGGEAMDTSETLTGKRGRAPVGGVMDSDVPGQSADKKFQLSVLHLAFVTY